MGENLSETVVGKLFGAGVGIGDLSHLMSHRIAVELRPVPILILFFVVIVRVGWVTENVFLGRRRLAWVGLRIGDFAQGAQDALDFVRSGMRAGIGTGICDRPASGYRRVSKRMVLEI